MFQLSCSLSTSPEPVEEDTMCTTRHRAVDWRLGHEHGNWYVKLELRHNWKYFIFDFFFFFSWLPSLSSWKNLGTNLVRSRKIADKQWKSYFFFLFLFFKLRNVLMTHFVSLSRPFVILLLRSCRFKKHSLIFINYALCLFNISCWKVCLGNCSWNEKKWTGCISSCDETRWEFGKYRILVNFIFTFFFLNSIQAFKDEFDGRSIIICVEGPTKRIKADNSRVI